MKCKIELTQNQLLVVIRAIELMMKTGLGQINELVEWIITVRNQGDEFGENVETRKKDVADFLAISSEIEPFFKGVITKKRRSPRRKFEHLSARNGAMSFSARRSSTSM